MDMGRIELGQQQLGRMAELFLLQFVPADLYPMNEPLALTIFSKAAKSLGTLSVRWGVAVPRTRLVQELALVGGPKNRKYSCTADETIWVKVMSQRCGPRGLEAVRVRVIERDPVRLRPQARAGQIFDVKLVPERKVARPVARTPSAAVRTSTRAA